MNRSLLYLTPPLPANHDFIGLVRIICQPCLGKAILWVQELKLRPACISGTLDHTNWDSLPDGIQLAALLWLENFHYYRPVKLYMDIISYLRPWTNYPGQICDFSLSLSRNFVSNNF